MITTVKTVSNIHHPPKFPCTPWQSHPPDLPIPRQPLICFLSLRINLHFSRFLYNWNHTAYNHLNFKPCNYFESHPHCYMYQ